MSSIYKSVSKPGRYTGGEFGQIIKDKTKMKARWAFCFPDSYEIGLSNLGVQILYGVLNKEPDVWCERAYTPWPDMQDKMKEYGIPLCAHESKDPLSDFDIVGFTLQYEMCYTNVLQMLKLGNIPLRAEDRGENDPIIIGGGPCAYNPEPVADFFDCFSIGEGEESLVAFTRLYIKMKEEGTYTRKAFLHEAAKLGQGIYVPSLYDVSYNEDGTVKAYSRIYDDIPQSVTKCIIKDMDKAFFPENVVVPNIEAVQERIMLEVYRGCIRGCRFCQAGMIYRPVREKTPEVLCRQAKCLYENTGFEEISLSSLSISDYSELPALTDGLIDWSDKNMISLSLPSLRVDSFTKGLMDKVKSVRSSSLTFAPEAGTQRLRDVINKNVFEEDLLDKEVFSSACLSCRNSLLEVDSTVTHRLEDGLKLDLSCLFLDLCCNAVVLEVNALNSAVELCEIGLNVNSAVLEPVCIRGEVDIGSVLYHIIENGLSVVFDKFKVVMVIEEIKAVLPHLLARGIELVYLFIAELLVDKSFLGHSAKTDIVAAKASVLLHKSLGLIKYSVHRNVGEHDGESAFF